MSSDLVCSRGVKCNNPLPFLNICGSRCESSTRFLVCEVLIALVEFYCPCDGVGDCIPWKIYEESIVLTFLGHQCWYFAKVGRFCHFDSCFWSTERSFKCPDVQVCSQVLLANQRSGNSIARARVADKVQMVLNGYQVNLWCFFFWTILSYLGWKIELFLPNSIPNCCPHHFPFTGKTVWRWSHGWLSSDNFFLCGF